MKLRQDILYKNESTKLFYYGTARLLVIKSGHELKVRRVAALTGLVSQRPTTQISTI